MIVSYEVRMVYVPSYFRLSIDNTLKYVKDFLSTHHYGVQYGFNCTTRFSKSVIKEIVACDSILEELDLSNSIKITFGFI